MFDDGTLRDMAQDYPLGFYICDLDKFTNNYGAFLQAFRSFYPNVRIAYSYKTNYLPAICRVVDELGGYAEVVSRMEYDLALRLGVEGRRIIFNGPLKAPADYVEAARLDSIINLDSDYEIEILEALSAERADTRCRVGIRCAVPLSDAAPTRFGFDISDPGFLSRVERLQALASVDLEGLHCHMIPPGRTAENYARMCQRLLDLCHGIWGAKGPRFVDMGGGFFSNMSPEMRAEFGRAIPAFEDYGEAIGGTMAKAYDPANGPELILEPGLAVVADAFSFVCRVLDTKTVCGRRIALAGASVYNVKPTKSRRNLPVRRIPATNGVGGVHPPVVIGGYTCMEDDVLHNAFDAPLSAGDLLVFQNVGAYTLVLKPPFIQGNAPVLAYRKGMNKRVELKRAETLDDFMRSYQLDGGPARAER